MSEEITWKIVVHNAVLATRAIVLVGLGCVLLMHNHPVWGPVVMIAGILTI